MELLVCLNLLLARRHASAKIGAANKVGLISAWLEIIFQSRTAINQDGSFYALFVLC